MAKTLIELRDELNELIEQDPENGGLEVQFSYNYGDYWKTVVSAPVTLVEQGLVTHSDYHQMNKVVMNESGLDSENEQDFSDPKFKQVILIF